MYDVASTTVSWTRHDKTHLGQPGGWPQLNRNAKSVGSDYRSQRTAVDLEPAKTSSQGCCRFVSLKRSASVPFFFLPLIAFSSTSYNFFRSTGDHCYRFAGLQGLTHVLALSLAVWPWHLACIGGFLHLFLSSLDLFSWSDDTSI
jgi:hypothetical protein